MLDSPGPQEPQQSARMARTGTAVFVVVASVVVVALTYALFVRTLEGQRLEQIASHRIGQGPLTRDAVENVLHKVSVTLIVLTLGACAVVAGLRRRWVLAAGACGLVAGANLTTQALKQLVLTRPDFGYGTLNSFPSGHITVVASLVLAALLVVPRSIRWLVELAGSVGVAVIGAGAVVTSWHYPSDIIGGLAVTLAWGVLVLLAVSRVGDRESRDRPHSHPAALILGLVVAAAIFVAFGVRPDESMVDLVILATTMSGLAVAGALTVGVFAKMLDANVA